MPYFFTVQSYASFMRGGRESIMRVRSCILYQTLGYHLPDNPGRLIEDSARQCICRNLDFQLPSALIRAFSGIIPDISYSFSMRDNRPVSFRNKLTYSPSDIFKVFQT